MSTSMMNKMSKSQIKTGPFEESLENFPQMFIIITGHIAPHQGSEELSWYHYTFQGTVL